ncbi:hypothetical protein RF11_00350 [Thelohanellus kitauei]|uniref:HTH psq-type domain-containing protein n=1 Tax=Thelohanellus kitauei TaxID=669202 RepID=A0A0C2MLK5_THEKT|nr:hypothetical protein RF11_00350 [Thelohanellus kitauei]
MTPVKCTAVNAHHHSDRLPWSYVYLLRISAHRFNGYSSLHTGRFMATFRDPTQPPRALHLIKICKTMLSESRSNKTLSLSGRIDTIARHYGVHRSQISPILKNREHILQNWESNTNADRQKRKRTCKAEDESAVVNKRALLMEGAKQLAQCLNVKDFDSNNGFLEWWKERTQEADYFGVECWSRDVPLAVIKDFDAKYIFNVDETGLHSRAIPEWTIKWVAKIQIHQCCLKTVETNANDHPTLPLVTFVDFLQSLKRFQSNLDACDYDD